MSHLLLDLITAGTAAGPAFSMGFVLGMILLASEILAPRCGEAAAVR